MGNKETMDEIVHYLTIYMNQNNLARICVTSNDGKEFEDKVEFIVKDLDKYKEVS